MYAKGKTKGTIRFAIKSQASDVKLAGDFNGWVPMPMRGQKNGIFALDVPISSGRCQYKFVVNGQWLTDPDHNNMVGNPYGSANSVASV